MPVSKLSLFILLLLILKSFTSLSLSNLIIGLFIDSLIDFLVILMLLLPSHPKQTLIYRLVLFIFCLSFIPILMVLACWVFPDQIT